VEFLTALFIGLAAAAGGTLFPGMLNMTAVSTSLTAGVRAGYLFAGGLAATFMLQAGVSIFFAKYLSQNPGIIEGMKQWAIVIFLGLAIFFTVQGFRARAARKAEIEKPYKGGPFINGMILAAMNFLTVPYFFALGGWLIADGYLAVSAGSKAAFTLGAGSGSLLVFGGYARLSDWISRNAAYFTRNINFFLGGLFVLLACIQGMRMI
jgi:threonine/homoserine/homoserine lactone efflux protein